MWNAYNNGYRARPDLKLAIKLRDGFRCMYCNRNLADAMFTEVTIDHLVPACDGGTNETINCITACRKCNCSRQDKPWKAFAFKTGGKQAVTRILRNTRREIKKYRNHAKALIAEGYTERNTTCHAFTKALK